MTISRVAKWIVVLLSMGTSGLLWADDSPPSAALDWALEFDGVNDYVNLGSKSSLQLSDDMAICAWFKLAEGTSGWDMGIAGKLAYMGNSLYYGFLLSRMTDNKLYFLIGSATGYDATRTRETCSDSEWHHATGVIQGGGIYLYLDAVLVDSDWHRTMIDSGQYAFVGRELSNIDGYSFDGLIDDVRFYDRALTSQEVTTVLLGGLRTDGSLVGLWDMEQSSGQVVYDQSGWGNHGTLGRSTSVDTSDPLRVHLTRGSETTCSTGWTSSLTFDSYAEYTEHVTTNNAGHTYNDGSSPVQRVVNQQPDPKGMLRMHNLVDVGPQSSERGYVIQARASVLLSPPNPCAGSYLASVAFAYKFRSTSGCLNVSCGGKRSRSVMAPDSSAAGGAGVSTWGQYSEEIAFATTNSPLSLEFELSGPEGTEVVVNNLFVVVGGRWITTMAVSCYVLPGPHPVIRCISFNGDIAGPEGSIGPEDFLAAVLSCGSWIGSEYDCLDETFTCDTFASPDDALYFCWKNSLGSLHASGMYDSIEETGETAVDGLSVAGGCQIDAPLLIAGKRYVFDPTPGYGQPMHYFLQDGLFGLDDREYAITSGPCAWSTDGLCGRVAQDTDGKVYQLDVKMGVVDVATGKSVLMPTRLSYSGGSVDVGYSSTTGAPPLQDLAVYSSGGKKYACVVPVVVRTAAGWKYRAAAKIELGTTAYSGKVMQAYGTLYDTGAYEIELDSDRNVYILDKQQWHDSRLLKFNPSGIGMNGLPDVKSATSISVPVAFHVSRVDKSVLIAEPSAVTFLSSSLGWTKRIEVEGIGYITSIAQEPSTRALWVTGFVIPELPPDENILNGATGLNKPDYRPVVARIPWNTSDCVQAVCVCDYTSGGNDYLSLPLSILWMDQ